MELDPTINIRKQRTHGIILAVGLGLCGMLAIGSLLRKSITIDETVSVPCGLAILEQRAYHLDHQTTPLWKLLPALPLKLFGYRIDTEGLADARTGWECARRFAERNAADYHRLFLPGRFLAVAALLGLCLVTYAYGRDLYGPTGGLLAFAFTALCPNLIAHGRLATSDIYLALFLMASLWRLHRFLLAPGSVTAGWLGLTVGLACLAKYTGLLLFGILPLAVVIAGIMQRNQAAPDRLFRTDRSAILWLVAAGGVAVLVLNAGYAFQGFGALLGDYVFTTDPFLRLQRLLPAWLPLPLPFHFVMGMDAQLGEGGYIAYLCGELNREGFTHYYVIAMLVKTATPALALGMVALALRKRLLPSVRTMPALLCGGLLFAFFSLASHKNIGIRYVLFLFPLLALAIGSLGPRLGAGFTPGRRALRFGFGVGLLWMLALHLWTWPDYLPFFNRISGGAPRGHTYLLDSNLDWGQDLIALRAYQQRNRIERLDLAYAGRVRPDVYGIVYDPLYKGHANRYCVISANLLWGRPYFMNGTQDYLLDHEAFAAFRRLRPVSVLGHTLYVYDTEALHPRTD